MPCLWWRNLKPMATLCGYFPQRYFLSIMCALALINAYTMRMCLNIAITVMVKAPPLKHGAKVLPGTCPAIAGEVSASSVEGEFDWSQSEQGMVLGSFFWLYWASHVPGGMAAERWGGKTMLFYSIFVTAICTILSPLAVHTGGLYALLVLRVIEGAFEGPSFPAVNVLLAHWAPDTEKSFHGSLSFSGVIMGSVIGNGLSGVVLNATNNNWALVFYLFGGAALVWCLIFWLFCASDPWQHPFISEKELAYLEETVRHVAHGTPNKKTPWKAMALSLPVMAVIFGQIGHDLIWYMVVTDLPKYLADVLHFPVIKLGIYTSLPYMIDWVVAISTGRLADIIITRGWMKKINVRRMFATLGKVTPSIGIVGASFAGCDITLVIIAFTIGIGVMGTFYPGVKVNSLDICPNFAGVLMGVVNGIGALAGVVMPLLVGFLTPNSALEEWRLAFIIAAVSTCICNLIFCIFASGSVQPWNDPQPTEE